MTDTESRVAKIERFFADRYGREALFLPSGRLALLLAFHTWLRSGDRILMSPVNDDVVFFLVLAAGLEPVIGPIDPATGNLDPDAVPAELWPSLRAVLTTNLYGIPDNMQRLRSHCDQHGSLLIEDACHALDSRFLGQRIGSFGTVAVFSLAKHLGVAGGVLSFADSSQHASLIALAAKLLQPRRLPASLGYLERPYLLDAIQRLRLAAGALRVRNALGLGRASHDGDRIPYHVNDIELARKAADPLTGFRRWLRMDHAAWRMPAPAFYLRTILNRLDGHDENLSRRLAGQRMIRECSHIPNTITLPDNTALFRVPLFAQDRDRIRRICEMRGLPINYIYDPPLDRYAHPSLAKRIPSPPAALVWSRDVLPVDPLHARRFVRIMEKMRGPVPVWTQS